jgi:hypothetical protein
MTNKIEEIIDNVDITEEIEKAGDFFYDVIVKEGLSRRAAFFGCIDILMMYGDQKEWNSSRLKDAISRYIDLHMKKE